MESKTPLKWSDKKGLWSWSMKWNYHFSYSALFIGPSYSLPLPFKRWFSQDDMGVFCYLRIVIWCFFNPWSWFMKWNFHLSHSALFIGPSYSPHLPLTRLFSQDDMGVVCFLRFDIWCFTKRWSWFMKCNFQLSRPALFIGPSYSPHLPFTRPYSQDDMGGLLFGSPASSHWHCQRFVIKNLF